MSLLSMKTEENTIIHAVAGFTASGIASGLRKSGKKDLSIVASEKDCVLAAVFTTNQVKAAPVLLNMQRLAEHSTEIRAVVTNAANANACTGQQGIDNAHQTAVWVAEQLNIKPEQVLVQSTGVIGVQLPMDILATGIPQAAQTLEADGWLSAATAIMTTDTQPKYHSVVGAGYTITGIAKGSGMIAPNMATMLGIITTDVQIEQSLLQQALTEANGQSFNCISVDGDTSTNDTVLLLANGMSDVVISAGDTYQEFVAQLTTVCTELAQMIVLDGEGATKFITVEVTGAEDNATAHAIANTIATSPLVKTAFYGSDANWGRILAAAGRAGVGFEPNQVDLWFSEGQALVDGLQVVANGQPTDYAEEDAAHIFAQEEITVQLNLNASAGSSTVWTCDLSHDYVSINADYRT